MKSFFTSLFGSLLFVLIASTPLITWAQTEVVEQIETTEKDNIRMAHETEEQLLALGCERVLITDKQTLASAKSLDWFAVIPVDANGEAVAMCSPNIVQLLKPLEPGQVLQAGGVAVAPVSTNKNSGAKPALTLSKIVQNILESIANQMLSLGKKFFTAVSWGIGPALTVSNFTSNDATLAAWPIMLGIANLGFLLALITIALLVTLRSSAGGGAKKLLPRLLIGALLINFSLIISGAIIDLSRLLMIFIVNMLGLGNLNESFFAHIQSAAGIDATSIFLTQYGSALEGWSKTGSLFIEAILMWALTIAVVIMLLTLIIRYIALLLLVIISPFAYLAFAFPGAQKIASAWWSYFMRYVLFGPIVLLLIAIAVMAAGGLSPSFFPKTYNGVLAYAFLRVAIFITGFIFAATVGRSAGIAGSSMILNTASRTGKKARSLAYRSTAPARNVVKDAGRGLGEGARSRIPRRIRPIKRDKNGVPLKGQRRPIAQSLGSGLVGGKYDRKQKREANEAKKRFTPTGSTPAARTASVKGNTAWNPSKLKTAHVGESISQDNRKTIMSTGSPEQKTALAGNAEAVRKMGSSEKDFILNLDVNLPTSPSDPDRDSNKKENSINRDIQKAFHSAVSKLDKENG